MTDGREPTSENLSSAGRFHHELTNMLLDPFRAEDRGDGHYVDVSLQDGRLAAVSTHFHYWHMAGDGRASHALDVASLHENEAIINIALEASGTRSRSIWVLRPGDLGSHTSTSETIRGLLSLNAPDEYVAFELDFRGGPHITPIDDPMSDDTLRAIVQS